jgi:TRAP-type mannitol/chloroaromatic compound transport system permease small subunit
MLKKTLRFIDNLSDKSGKVISPMIYVVLGTLVFEVFARYLFNRPTIWAHETSTFFYGAYFMLGAAYCLRHEGMITVDIIQRRLPRRIQALLNMITFVFFLAVCLVLLWLGGKDALYSWKVGEHTNTTWEPPLYPLKTVIPVAAFLLLLQGIARFIRDASIACTGKEVKED